MSQAYSKCFKYIKEQNINFPDLDKIHTQFGKVRHTKNIKNE